MDPIVETLRIAPPPNAPLALDFTWPDVESHLGMRLPEDFKALVSLYGSGTFKPSDVRLCNFRNAIDNECDYISRVQADAGSPASDDLTYFPKPGGLLPFGSWGPDDHFFWRTDRDPWGLVMIENVGWNVEDIAGLTTAEFLLRALNPGPDGAIETAAESWTFEPQSGHRFVPGRRLVDVHPEICRPVAACGGLVSYRFCNTMDFSVPNEMKLSWTEFLYSPSEKAWNGRWRWMPPDEHPFSTSGVIFFFSSEERGPAAKSPEQRCSECLELNAVKRRQQTSCGVWEGRSGRLHWVLIERQEPTPDIEWVVYGAAGSHGWSLSLSYPVRLVDRFAGEAERIAKSVRPIP